MGTIKRVLSVLTASPESMLVVSVYCSIGVLMTRKNCCEFKSKLCAECIIREIREFVN